jgi:hypothetical protein
MRVLLSNIATISPRSIGFLIILGGWEPIYQILRFFNIVGDDFSGFFIVLGIALFIGTFAFDYIRLKIRAKKVKRK